MTDDAPLVLDLTRAASEEDVIRAFLELLDAAAVRPLSWVQVARVLRSCRMAHTFRLVGLNHLERTAPNALVELFGVLGRHNSAAGAVIQSVTAGDDYQATVYCVTLGARLYVSGREEEGAFVNCWIKCSAAAEAEERARAAVEGAGWHVISVDECVAVTRSDYGENLEALELLEQCYVDHEVLSFNTWAIAPDG